MVLHTALLRFSYSCEHNYAISRSLERVHDIDRLRPRQNDRYFVDDMFKWIFLNENIWIAIKIPQKFIPRRPINNIPALIEIMA